MHGFTPSHERPRPSSRWSSEWNFGLAALVVLAALAIAAALLMPHGIAP
jgi:hypothetical protein